MTQLGCAPKNGGGGGAAAAAAAVAAGAGAASSLCGVQSLGIETVYALGACHSLVLVDDRMEGDPMERAAVEWMGWALQRDGSNRPVLPRGPGRREANEKLRVVRKWPFEAVARRMSVVVCLEHRGTRDLWCVRASGCARVARGNESGCGGARCQDADQGCP